MAALSDRDRLILDLEARYYRHTASKEQAARDELGLTAIRYTQILNTLIDSPDALAYDAVTVKRLRRLRAARRRRAVQRSA